MAMLLRELAGIAGLPAMIRGSRKGISDFLVSLIPQAVHVVTGFAGSVLVARGLGPAGLGQYALITSLSSLAASLSDLGIGQTAIRYASQATAQDNSTKQFEVLRWAFRLRTFLVMAVTVVVFLAIPLLAKQFWNVPELIPLLRLGLAVGVASALSAVPIVYFQSARRFAHNAAVQTGQALLLLGGLVVLALTDQWSVATVVSVSILATWLGALLFLCTVPGAALFLRSELEIKLSAVFRLFKGPSLDHDQQANLDTMDAHQFARYNIIGSIIVLLLSRVDVWAIGAKLGETQVGIYNAATRFTIPLTIVLGAFNTVLWPRASALKNHREVSALLRKISRGSIILAFGSLIYAFIVPELAPTLLGGGFAESTSLARLLCMQRFFSLILSPLALVGYSLGLVRYYWIMNCIQLLLVVGLNVALLPMIGPSGSAVALIANDVFALGAIAGLVRFRLRDLQRRDEAAQGLGPIVGVA